MISIDSHQVLKAFKIPPTGNRAKILELVISKGGASFTADDLVREMTSCNFQVTKTSVSHVLRLFTVRGVIFAVEPKKTLMRGRPPALFVISPRTQSLVGQSSQDNQWHSLSHVRV